MSGIRPARGLRALVAQRRFVYLVVAMLSVGGIWEATRLPAAIYPELHFSRITVVAQGGALGARQVLFGVTKPLEEAVSVVPGVVRVDSRTLRGGSEVDITFAPSTDMVVALQQIRSRTSELQPDLPAGMNLQVERLTPSLFPILSYNLEGGDPATLYDIARYQIRPLISRVPGVARVDVQGSDVREIEVIADPARLAAAGLTYAALADAIRAATTVSAVGRMPSSYRQFLIVTSTEATSIEDIGAVVVSGGSRVRDLATVIPGTQDHVRIVAGDGKPAATLNISRQLGGNTLAIADSIAAIARTIAPDLPPGVRLKPLYDQASLVREAMASVRDAMIIGAVLATIILLLFLRYARITAIAASSIPLTLAITVLVMALLGQTFNLMTLGAMAIAIGLVIDDAVVVTENIVRHARLEPDRIAAVGRAVRELVWPVTTSTATTVVVFLPLGLLSGVEGQFFHALSITLAVAVIVSLALAFTIIPLLGAQFLQFGDSLTEQHHNNVFARLRRRIEPVGEWYQRSLAHALRHPRVMVAIAIALVIAGAISYRFVGTGFLPEMDEGAFVLDYWTPGGTALAETDREIHIVEKILAATPEVDGTSRRTGAELGLFATEQNTGDIVVRLKPASQRSRSSAEVIDDVRERIAHSVPRLRVEFVQILSDVINDLAGADQPVEIKMFGPDLAALEAYGRAVAPPLQSIAGIEDLYDGSAEPTAELAMMIDAPRAARVGLTPHTLSDQVAGALLGVDAGTVRLGDRAVAVRVRAPDAVRFDATRLAELPILDSAGTATAPLANFASFTPVETRSELLRENQQQMITITADISGRPLGAIMKDVKSVLAAHPPPGDARVELAGQYAGQRAAFRALLAVLLLAALGVVTVMVVQFRSFVEPLIVLLAAPVSFVGALMLLWITNTVLNVSSFMGLILLVGLIVKNGIILLEFAQHRMECDGVDLATALQDAARIRLRPILMTTLCTLFGLLPLALGLGAGSALQRPLALAVIGGLALSTPITLYLVPAFLVAARGAKYRLRDPR